MQNLIFIIVMISFPILAVSSDSGKIVDLPEKIIFVIPVKGTVEPGMAAFLARATRQAHDSGASLIIIEMDTFGGRVDAALQIVDTLQNVQDSTIAFVKNKAISAGALIALACNDLVMKNGTTIGDCEPITYSEGQPVSVGEKVQSPLRATFRSLAKRNGFPQTLAEAMVSKDMTVFKVELPDTVLFLDSIAFAELADTIKNKIITKKTVVAPGKLLTMDDEEAVELGFSKMSVSSIEEMLEKMGIAKYKLIRLEENWSETFVRFLSRIAPLLMMIGLAALYIEIRSPGFGVFGIIGIICLALVFTGQYMVGLANYTELLLIVLGIVLLGVELFVTPGFGIMGLAGIACIGFGLILSLQGFVIPRPDFPWQRILFIKNISLVLGSFIGSLVIALTVLRYAFPQLSKVVSGPYLEASLKDSHVELKDNARIHVGESGTIKTACRPSGKAKIGNTVFDVVAGGEFLEAGEDVVVTEIHGNRIVVTRKTGNES